MGNTLKKIILNVISKKCGLLRKLDKSNSLYEIVDFHTRIYFRYSKIHNNKRPFYGLRQDDLIQLEGHNSFICFLWENQTEPLFLPYSDYEEIFQSISPASDGQYKVQIYLEENGTELYIARAGRFNVESHLGWQEFETLIDTSKLKKVPKLSHPQIQTLLGAIGTIKGFDIWIPQYDRNKLDWNITTRFQCCSNLPSGFTTLSKILQEIDVIWIERGSNNLKSLFEVEHSTPIYSCLLRFNDILLLYPYLNPRFSIVSNDTRKSLFVKQLNRPTFQRSKLSELCNFLEYVNVYGWFERLRSTL